MRYSTILIALLYSVLAANMCNAQMWKFAETGTSATILQFETDSMGNSYLLGTFYGEYFHFQNDSVPGSVMGESYVILKLNPAGKLLWLHSIYGNDYMFESNSPKIKINQNGDLAFSIQTYATGDIFLDDRTLQSVDNTYSYLLMKIGKKGYIHWSHVMHLAVDMEFLLTLSDFILDETGNFYATGYFEGANLVIGFDELNLLNSEITSFILQITNTGARNLYHVGTLSDGSTGNLSATRICKSDNNLYLAGTYSGVCNYSFGQSNLPTGFSDVFIAAYNNLLSPQWATSFIGNGNEIVATLQANSLDEVIITGYSQSSSLQIGINNYDGSTGYNLFIARVFNNLEYVEAISKFYHTQLEYLYEPYNNFITSSIDKENYVYFGTQFKSASITIDSIDLNNVDANYTDIVFAKLSPDSLNAQWAKRLSSTSSDELSSSTTDISGNIFIGGASDSSIHYDATALTTNGVNTRYCAKINTEGALDYSYSHENTYGINAISSLHAGGDIYGNLYISGIFDGISTTLGTYTVPLDYGIIVGKYSQVRSLTGNVQIEGGSAFNEGIVNLYGYAYLQDAPLNDTVSINPDGSFEFTNIPIGNYILVVIPTGDATNTYLPTYFPAKRYWENCIKIQIRPLDPIDPITITMIEKSVLTGSTEFNGNVSQSDDVKAIKAFNFNKAKPQTEANVVLAGNRRFDKADEYDIVAITQTDINGNFAFYNIDNGTYYLWVDMPGLPCDVHEVIVDGNNLISNINYLVTESEIIHSGSIIYTSSAENEGEISNTHVKIYPNPVTNTICIDIKDLSQARADIYDAQGKYIDQFELKEKTTRYPASQLKPGNYFIRITSSEKVLMQKVTIVK